MRLKEDTKKEVKRKKEQIRTSNSKQRHIKNSYKTWIETSQDLYREEIKNAFQALEQDITRISDQCTNIFPKPRASRYNHSKKQCKKDSPKE